MPHAVLVLCQPGAVAFFAPVLPVLRKQGWMVTASERFEPPATDAVIVTSTTYSPAERAALEWAKARGVRSAQLIDSWYEYRRRIELTNGPGAMPDEIWVFDDIAKADCVADGLPGERVRVVGSPVWEDVAPFAEAASSDVLLIDQPLTADAGQRRGYTEADFLNLVRSNLGKDHRATLALHPRRAQNDRVGDGFQVTRDTREAATRCGTVVGMFSSFLIDAFLAGRRVVSVQPHAKGHDYCILSRLGLVPRVTSGAELAPALASAEPGPRGFERRFAGSRARVIEALTALA